LSPKPYILPVIILSQFACTSLWFAGNAIVDELILRIGFGTELVGHMLSSVQFGFITGTLVFALLMIADRFSPSRIFMVCSILAALCNVVALSDELTKWILLLSRFGTGFFLAGIYPVGMKIAADYYEKGLGKALGFLVGALVLGAAFPYFISSTNWGSNPDIVIQVTSSISVLGGLTLWILVPNGPYRKPSLQLKLRTGPELFKLLSFRKAALGYFGHMWELYAFWAFTPLAIQTYNEIHAETHSISLWTGTIIALGGLSCVLGGMWSQTIGSYKVAKTALALSGLLCILSPLLFQINHVFFLMGWCFWGMAVTADSPQFSTLVAAAVPPKLKGTGLTLVNCIGFAISIASIQILSHLSTIINPKYLFTLLAIGPILGLISLRAKSS
jgi:MFS family permease